LEPEDEMETFPGKNYILGGMDYEGFLGSEAWRDLFSESAKVNDWLPNSGVRDEAKLARDLANVEKDYARGSEEFYRACNDVIYKSKSGIYPLASEAGNQYNFFQVRDDKVPYRFHKGNDMGASDWTSIYATYYGEVTASAFSADMGNYIEITASFAKAANEDALAVVPKEIEGAEGRTVIFNYMHMKESALDTWNGRGTGNYKSLIGERVSPGDLIGRVGGTGGYDSHLHMDVRKINTNRTDHTNFLCVYFFTPIDPFHPFYPANP
jgi:murein DD-endopeptidase MepM/ murein hydrolase activator NlpD